nr:hypothetical transcript [Hymenolepis microstoma]
MSRYVTSVDAVVVTNPLSSSVLVSQPFGDETPKISIELNDDDLEESFIHGWGPGGQAINKTANCVRLKHIPTGITIKCQDGRNLQANRFIARRRLIEQLDIHFNREESERAQRKRDAQTKENHRFSRAKRRLEMKAAFKKKLLSEDEEESLSNKKGDETPKISIELNDDDLEESFIHGWGPGGQAINKTANCVRLKHIPTGITIKCQDGRNLQANRFIARRRLIEQLDIHFNREESERAQRKRDAQTKENHRFSRAKRRLEMKAAFKKKLLSEDEEERSQ